MHDLEKLEFPKVLNLISSYCISEYGKEKIKELKPNTEFGDYDKVEEMHSFILRYGGPDISIPYVREELSRIFNGYIPDTTVFLNIHIFLSNLEKLKRSIEKLKSCFPKIWDILKQMNTFPNIRELIHHSIDENGLVKDTASEKLRSIRKSKKMLEMNLKKRMWKIANEFSNIIQQPYYTKRDGRYVLLVKSDRRKEIKGLVISTSSSGATLYLEPEDVLPLNNELKKLEIEEEREVRRILENIAFEIVRKKDSFLKTMDIFGYFDSVYARAIYMIKKKCIIPLINDEGRIKLVRARHPLIPEDKVVPIDVEVGTNFQGLILTGPNTGGKTVTLKTIGLLSLMAMASIPIPADVGTELSKFKVVLADIGDEQSIEQSLSTFSSHIMKISFMMRKADHESLILLDELGAGTDPIEGAALAVSIVKYFLNKGAKLVVTTHLMPLKLLAFKNIRLQNAAVEFDSNTLMPTYRIIMGFAGSSQALEIAKRYGIPLDVIKAARMNINEEYTKLEGAMEEIYRKKILLDEKLSEIVKDRRKLEEEKNALSVKIDRLKKGKIEELITEFKEIREEIKRIKKTIEKSIHEIKKAKSRKNIEKLREIRKELEILEANKLNVTEEKIHTLSQSKMNLKNGDTVRIRGTSMIGRISKIENDKAFIISNNLKMVVPVTDLERVKIDVDESPSDLIVSLKSEKKVPVIDVRGLKVSEIEWKVRKFIDDLIIGGFNKGYIIHGVGSGKLARGIHKILKSEPRVKRFNFGDFSTGGSGVTVVEIM